MKKLLCVLGLAVASLLPASVGAQPLVCTTENYLAGWTWEDCSYGTLIEVTNQQWRCTRPLSSYGTLPLKVVARWSIVTTSANIAVSADTGCDNPPGQAVNLIVDAGPDGNGQISDVFKTRGSPGPSNLVVTGRFDCGVRVEGDHQDGIQLQASGPGTVFVNAEVGGDYDVGEPNCQGAGGALFYSMRDPQTLILGGTFLSCRAGISVFPGEAGPGSGARHARFRARGPTTPFCAQFHPSAACVNENQLSVWESNSCQRYVGGQWVEESQTAPPSSPPPPPPSPPPPPPGGVGLG